MDQAELMRRFLQYTTELSVVCWDGSAAVLADFERQHSFLPQVQPLLQADALEELLAHLYDGRLYEARDLLGMGLLLFRFAGRAFVMGPFATVAWEDGEAERTLAALGLPASYLLPYKLYYGSHRLLDLNTAERMVTGAAAALDPQAPPYLRQTLAGLRGSGIGRACALALAGAGASVLVVGRRAQKLDAVCAEVRAAGGRCEAFAADLTQEDNCRAMVEACRSRFGRVDILINSAGSRGANGDLATELTAENLRATFAADFDSTFFATRYAWPVMAAGGGGSIINIASLAALQARGPVVYAAAKGAVRSFSRAMAKRLGPQNVRVNTIYPGFILTEMTRGVLDDPAMKARFEADSPLGLIGEAGDIAACALYLAGDAARFVTGQDFVIDGGATC